MDCVYHSSTNMLLKAPEGMPNCVDIPATMLAETPPPVIATFWRPTPEELALLTSNGLIGLWVFGTAHPPVAITVEASK